MCTVFFTLPMTKQQYENLEKLRAALESGTYMQGRGHLRIDDSYCCMGVAADLIDPNGWDGFYNKTRKVTNYRHNHGVELCATETTPQNGCNYLSKKGLEYYGLTHNEQALLTKMNDFGESFSEIAERIHHIMKRYESVNLIDNVS